MAMSGIGDVQVVGDQYGRSCRNVIEHQRVDQGDVSGKAGQFPQFRGDVAVVDVATGRPAVNGRQDEAQRHLPPSYDAEATCDSWRVIRIEPSKASPRRSRSSSWMKRASISVVVSLPAKRGSSSRSR